MEGRRLRLTLSLASALFATAASERASAEEPVTPTPSSTATTEREPRKPPAPPGPNEVRVNGTKGEATAPKDTMREREIREVPGAFGDAFRALETLPGVTPIVSGLPYFFVRGAPPGNTGFFVDGVRVPGLFHLGVGPAVMYPAIIDHVDLYKGAYPVSFGRFAGGVLSAETTRPTEQTKVDWTLRLFDAGALVEVPFGKDGDATPRGSALVSGRYGYPGLLLSIVAPDAGLAYWDYQTRVSYKVTDRDTVSLFSFGSYDSVSQREETDGVPDKTLTEVLNIQFHRLDLRWDHKTSATGSIRTAVTVGYDRTGSEGFAARSFVLGTRVVAQDRLSNDVQIRTGADAQMQTYDFRLGKASSGGGESSPSGAESGVQKDVNIGAWVDAPLKIGAHAEVTPGLRTDVFTSRGVGTGRALPSLDPRVTTRIGIGPIYHVAGIGIAHQPAAFPVPIPALTFAQLSRGLQSGYHMSQGLEIPLPASLNAQITGYLHTYTGLVDLASQCDLSDPRCDRSSTRGRSVGLEAMLKRNLSRRVSGWISYTLSRSTRDAYDPDLRRETTRLSEFDRTHVFNLVLSVNLGSGWRAGGRYAGYSGIPYSTVSEDLLPNARTPVFHRLDLRIEKRWVRPSGRTFALTAEMFNALLMKEAIGVSCTGTGSGYVGSCKPEEIGPIAIPSIGFEGTL